MSYMHSAWCYTCLWCFSAEAFLTPATACYISLCTCPQWSWLPASSHLSPGWGVSAEAVTVLTPLCWEATRCGISVPVQFCLEGSRQVCGSLHVGFSWPYCGRQAFGSLHVGFSWPYCGRQAFGSLHVGFSWPYCGRQVFSSLHVCNFFLADLTAAQKHYWPGPGDCTIGTCGWRLLNIWCHPDCHHKGIVGNFIMRSAREEKLGSRWAGRLDWLTLSREAAWTGWMAPTLPQLPVQASSKSIPPARLIIHEGSPKLHSMCQDRGAYLPALHFAGRSCVKTLAT